MTNMYQAEDAETDQTNDRLPGGVRVQLRNRLDGAWASGFQIFATQSDGYLVRRLSDRSVLPLIFAETDVRLDPIPMPPGPA